MEDARLEEPVYAIKKSMKETTDALIAHLVNWETPQQEDAELMLKIAILEENSNWVKLNVINAETAQSVKPQSTADAHAHKEQH